MASATLMLSTSSVLDGKAKKGSLGRFAGRKEHGGYRLCRWRLTTPASRFLDQVVNIVGAPTWAVRHRRRRTSCTVITDLRAGSSSVPMAARAFGDSRQQPDGFAVGQGNGRRVAASDGRALCTRLA